MRFYPAFLLLLLGATAACEPLAEGGEQGASSDAWTSPTPDAGGLLDVGERGDISSDAGSSAPCNGGCPDGLGCQQERCVRACPCAPGERCDPRSSLCRPSRCQEDSLCPPGLVCNAGRCVRLAGACLRDEDCPESLRCSAARVCTRADCVASADCPAGQRCAFDRCVDLVTPDPPILFERVRDGRLEAHFSSLPGVKENRHEETAGQYGYGAALLDFDGDLDLDVYVGSQTQDEGTGKPGCLYRNESVPGWVRFVEVTRHCGWRRRTIHGAFALDLENDGFHELLLIGERTLTVQRFYPDERAQDLRTLIPIDDERRACLPASAVQIDVNLDGRLDLYVGCQLHPVDTERLPIVNIVFLQSPDGRLVYASPSADFPVLMQRAGSTLALGVADLTGDGLLDLMVSQDSIALPGGQPTMPGGVYKRCNPSQRCRYQPYAVGQGEAAFRNLMGSGVLHIDGHGEFVYYSDIDTNQLIQVSDEPAQNRALEFGVALDRASAPDPVEFYSWGVVVDDFDRDGLDDLFVGRGSLVPHAAHDFAVHWDALMLQRPGQPFDVHSYEVGITPFTVDDTGDEEIVYASRAVLKTDLDYDGALDLFGLGMEGPPRLHREVEILPRRTPRCTLVPAPSLVPSFGAGFAVVAPDGVERKWDSQGQMRSGAAPFITTPWQRGGLRFPSGVVVDYDCGGEPGPLVVVEPDWLRLRLEAGELVLDVTNERPEGAVALVAKPSLQQYELIADGAGRYRVRLGAEERAVMLRFGARWLGRWFDLESL